MKRLTNIKWVQAKCHLCGEESKTTPVLLKGTPLTQGQFGYEVHPVICECGLVFLNPRWSHDTFGQFYENFYDDLYRLELKKDYGIKGVIQHMAEIWKRIKPNLENLPGIRNVLDVGCGSGHGLRYLKDQLPGIDIHGIEASPDCRDVLTREVGATLLDSDVDGPWLDNNMEKFELIIMRHVVEHLLSPIETLDRLKKALSPDGLLYIAVPDMMHPRTILRDYDKWWEYYFRAVHPYYYSRQTLFMTLEAAGLYPMVWGEENEEIWCLAGTKKLNLIKRTDLLKEQMAVLRQYLPGPQGTFNSKNL